MKTLKRPDFKNDEVFNFIYQQIMKNHKVAEHTQKVLIENKDVKDFCETAEHFSVIELDISLTVHISYDVNTWFKQGSFPLQIASITLYDSYDEYETNRKIRLFGAKNSDIPTFDLN